ncbi:MAG: hypothetical protein HN654_00810 [Candidatus Marinimicrobia bacterium]|jgi:hypothetical protein|nr:hypothetical protein [Candidatus Neomarinimicrobiota bacterium]MBT7518882.1 hypothetical protein [Candidatus Neomarinimicrobiota bacterium]
MHSVFKLFLILLFPLYGLGTQFLILPTDAEELSIGSHPTMSGILSVNPALFSASLNHPGLSISRGIWLGDVTLTHLGYTQPAKGKTFHFNAKYSGLSDLEFRDAVPVDDALSTFSSYGVSMNGGLSVQREKQKFGISFSYIFMGLYTETTSGFGLNLGYARDIVKGMKLGISIQNLGIMSKLSEDVPSLPTRMIGGVSKQIIFDNYRNTVYCSGEWNQLATTGKFHFGNNFRWDRISLMGGFSASENVVESSAGFGINLGQYEITYGIQFGSQNLGTPQILTFQFRLP